jgi:hypothetical protein
MASSHAVEWIDLKDSVLCETCRVAMKPVAQFQSVRID